MERRWCKSFDVSNLLELRAADLVKGEAYAVLMQHNEGCWLLAGGRCSCRPRTRFYVAEPLRQ
jgi:hypothetical protein